MTCLSALVFVRNPTQKTTKRRGQDAEGEEITSANLSVSEDPLPHDVARDRRDDVCAAIMLYEEHTRVDGFMVLIKFIGDTLKAMFSKSGASNVQPWSKSNAKLEASESEGPSRSMSDIAKQIREREHGQPVAGDAVEHWIRECSPQSTQMGEERRLSRTLDGELAAALEDWRRVSTLAKQAWRD